MNAEVTVDEMTCASVCGLACANAAEVVMLVVVFELVTVCTSSYCKKAD